MEILTLMCTSFSVEYTPDFDFRIIGLIRRMHNLFYNFILHALMLCHLAELMPSSCTRQSLFFPSVSVRFLVHMLRIYVAFQTL